MTLRTSLVWIGLVVSISVFGPGAGAAGTIKLQWDPNTASNIAGYKLSYGTASGQYTQTVDVGTNVTWTVTVSDTRTYYFAVQAYDTQGLVSPYSNEVSGSSTAPLPVVTSESIIVGLSKYSSNGGWLAVRNGVPNLTSASWTQLPWPAFNQTGGATHPAAGDVDGDGLDELIVGVGTGGAGWVAIFDDAAHGFALLKWIQVPWPAYNAANGEIWPAAGDLDGDGRAEIVLGLGAGGAGWIEIVDDAVSGYKHLTWRQVALSSLVASADGATHPAVGDVDGTGASEIIVGFGTGGGGNVEILQGTAGGYAHSGWLRAAWPTYNAANGATFPAAGDIDGDGRAEIVLGLGAGGGGWLEIAEDAVASYSLIKWRQVSWPSYSAKSSGETHPALGNVDGDTLAEIVVGLDTYLGNGGWIETLDDAVAGTVSLGWRNIEWAAYTTAGGGTYPAVGRFR